MRQLRASEVASVTKQLVAKQGNKCALCGKQFTQRDNAVLDHDHNTGVVRAAIHRSCNGAEGKVRTKANMGHKGVSADDFLIQLGKYLEYHSKPRWALLHPTFLTPDQKRIKRNAKARARRAVKKKLESK